MEKGQEWKQEELRDRGAVESGLGVQTTLLPDVDFSAHRKVGQTGGPESGVARWPLKPGAKGGWSPASSVGQKLLPEGQERGGVCAQDGVGGAREKPQGRSQGASSN